ncbi:imidazole glycerol phosphate synthase subunit HisF [Thermotalea metallivorans]|uniref:Imidazole glycerol phosphate synthase subunit HisF n=1 Tax=Thermotalea metallivorans TaxID=520762 RepID=A0A140L9I1_9FIRM|nr:imidazole glycerol phosphate synthase subunit HisF [Thermotalea metallivorans]KXG77206.1 Imidazole glycerol phosphate synthase subunit HisF [Thermotalea metallivorans]
MITKRIIPCLDVDGGRVVKGKKFQGLADVNDPVVLAKYYDEEGADELVFYDITATSDGRKIFLGVVERTAEAVYIPLTVGGGIRTVEDFTAVLRAGADKVSVNSAAVKNPYLITEAALKFGKQCVVLSMDIKRNQEKEWTVYIQGGRIDTGMDALAWAKRGEALGAGEIVVNCIDTDGMKEGYDLEVTRMISEKVKIPVVASGGAGKKEDFARVFTEGKADAALAASVFHYGDVKIRELKNYLYGQGIEVRR